MLELLELFDLSALLLDELLLLLNELFHGRYLMTRHYLRLRLWLPREAPGNRACEILPLQMRYKDHR